MNPATNLSKVLERLRGRITRLVWTHGLATVVGATTALLLLDFFLDWSLHVPRGVRWVNVFVLGALPTYLALRTLFRPLRARPDATECAVLLERAHPELRQVLVTAAELDRAPRPAADPWIAAAIREEAEAIAGRLDPSRALDPAGPRLRLLLGSLSTVACTAVLLSRPEAARVFFVRLFGGDAAWPQRTHLSIEVAAAGTASSARPSAGANLEVRVARGSDVPVLVRAEGVVPEEVTLHLSGGQRAVIPASGGDAFRTLLRSVQEDVEMYATGGDDLDEDPTVRLVVLRPPEVVGLAVEVEPPAYSGLSPSLHPGGDAEVLAGSRIVVHVLPDPADATGRARLLPEDRVVPLSPAPFPKPAAGDAAAGPATASPPAAGLAFSLAPEKTLRYRIELSDASKLENPDPGLFAITVIEDRPPEVEILAPGRGEFDTVPGGAISLRARARDDFGVSRMAFSATPLASAGAGEAPKVLERDLEWRLVPPAERTDGDRGAERPADAAPPADRPTDAPGSPTSPGRRPPPRPGERDAAALRSAPGTFRAVARGRARLQVAEIAGAGGAAPGAQVEVVVSATDTREPAPHEGRSAALRVRVVSSDEYLRRLQDRLGRARATAASLSELQRGKQRRTQELAAGLESDAALSGDAGEEIFAAATGERRVEGDARSLSRELCSALEGVLYARIDDRAADLLEKVDAQLADSDRIFDPAVWRAIAVEDRAATGAPSGLADRLLRIAGLALEVSEVDAPAATAALARAQDATDPARVHSELAVAVESQKAVVDKLESLLERLAEWDNYQSVLGLTRDILSGQKTLEERTKAFAKEH